MAFCGVAPLSLRCGSVQMGKRGVVGFLFLGVLALSAISMGLLAAANEQSLTTLPPIQSMELQQTPDGPVIQGLFGRFPWPQMPNTNPACNSPTCDYPRVKLVGTVCQNQRSIIYSCWPCSGASQCAPPKKPTDCCCQCGQAYPPSCTACYATGYCKGAD